MHRSTRAGTTLLGGALAALATVTGVPTGATASAAPLDFAHERSAVVVQASSVSAAAASVAAVGGTVTRDLAIVDGVAASVPTAQLARLRTTVRAVTPDALMHVQSDPEQSPADPRPVSVVNRSINADLAQAVGVTGKGIRVALVDTGVSEVPDLAGRIVPVLDPLSSDRSTAVDQIAQTVGPPGSPPDLDDVLGAPDRALVPCVDFSGEQTCSDSYGHGTFLAGLIAGNGAQSGGRYTGVAPEAEIVSIKIAGRDGSADVSKVLAAIQWVTSFKDVYGIRVLNLSLGTDSTAPQSVDPLNLAVQRAWTSGLVVTVAASNRGPSAGTISKPGDDPMVITVGAVHDRGTGSVSDDTVPAFTGRGPAVGGIAKPDLVAPGARVVSLQAPGSAVAELPGGIEGGYRQGSGTSMATAVVSGAAALLLQAHPEWTPDRLKSAVTSRTQRLTARDRTVVGSGMVDVARAGVLSAPDLTQVAPVFTRLGSLDDSRGGVLVSPDCAQGDVLDPVRSVLCPEAVTGETTSQLRSFDGEEYQGEWTGNSWYESQWVGNSWYGNSWYGNSWYGNSWYGESPDGSGGSTAGSGTLFGVPLPGGAWYGAWG